MPCNNCHGIANAMHIIQCTCKWCNEHASIQSNIICSLHNCPHHRQISSIYSFGTQKRSALSPCNNENRKHLHVGHLQVTTKSSYKCTSVTMMHTVTYSVQFTSLYFIILCFGNPSLNQKQTNFFKHLVLLDTTYTILQCIIHDRRMNM